ncbi:plastocyanin/azurin family copper-binding protein [Ruegeria sp. Alg231-54]|uniref:cupredoxin domain-containing protein n=1 Tax=Ruegeria sp. Alg231-54 TaxID=1922221 RepID=UPI000D557575|nr:plastocyanin/azurin family copper-binding protein [Ruegeria sp. Alg231-54]
MKKIIFTTALLVLIGTSVVASPSGLGTGNIGESRKTIVGIPGDRRDVDQIVKVSMKETDEGGMIFTPSLLNIKKGETIKFEVMNYGEVDHEFILDTPELNSIHKEIMAARTETHRTPNSVTLSPGEQGEVIWNFTNSGDFEYACLIPGHYDSGMFGSITVQ